MKHRYIVILSFLFSLMVMAEMGSQSYAWVGDPAAISFDYLQGSRLANENGISLTLQLQTTDAAQAQNFKSMSASNTDPAIDPDVYTNWTSGSEIRKTNTYYWFYIRVPYKGQYGSYNIEVTYQDDSTEILTTPAINQWTQPFKPPLGLEIVYPSDPATPTFRFMPIPGLAVDYYQVRVRYYETPDRARMIYRTTNITQWTPGRPIEVPFMQNSDGRGTEEPLVPGVEYMVRVDAYDQDGASPSNMWTATFHSQNKLYFQLPSSVYDDFSSTRIDKARWRWGESVREIDPIARVLRLATSTPHSSAMTSFPYIQTSYMPFSSPNSINSIEADVVMPVEPIVTGSGRSNLYLGGRFYNDGTPGGGYAGDIWAETGFRLTNGALRAYWYIGRYATSGSGISDIVFTFFNTTINSGAPYTLSIEYDPSGPQFIFKVGDEIASFGPDGLPSHEKDPSMPWKAITASARAYNANDSGYISGAIDNVYVNGSPYDDFSSSSIDPARWVYYEYVREISDGSLRLKGRSGPGYTSAVRSNVEFGSPALVNNIQAKVTVVDYQNPEGLYERADILGEFYHDGSVNDGRTGDVLGQIRLGGTGTSPIAEWEIYRFADAAGNTTETLDKGTFATSPGLKSPNTLFLGWDGNQIILKFNEEQVSYVPETAISPPKVPFRNMSVGIFPEATKKNGTMEVLYDDVMVNLSTQLKLHTPNGGEIISSGSDYMVHWEAPPNMTQFKLQYSPDGGKTWALIAKGITDRCYKWSLPSVSKNLTSCLIKLTGADASGKKLGTIISDEPFSIEGVKVVSPNGERPWTAGATFTITWLTPEMKREVSGVKLSYTKNGVDWLPVIALKGNPGWYDWTLPQWKLKKPKTNCKVKVVLLDAKGNKINSDTSDFFTIKSPE